MKTVIETREDLYQRYIPNKIEKVPIFDSKIKSSPSCFYDFGARKMAGFGEIVPPTKEKVKN